MQPGPATAQPPVPVKPDQPPFGSSPATGPTQNLGHMAAGLARIGLIVHLMAETIPLVGPASEIGQDLLDATRKLTKHVPPGAVGEAEKTQQMKALLQKQQQMAPQLAALRASQGTQQQPQTPAQAA